MSGKPWPPERREAFSLKVRARWRNGAFAKRRPATITDAERAARSARMKLLNARMRDDEQLKSKCIRGQKRVRRSASYRAMQSLVMTDVMARPELRRAARFHCIKLNKNPRVRKRQWAGRRRKARAAKAE